MHLNKKTSRDFPFGAGKFIINAATIILFEVGEILCVCVVIVIGRTQWITPGFYYYCLSKRREREMLSITLRMVHNFHRKSRGAYNLHHNARERL